MSYQKHTWVTNEIIRAKQLNHIENGIYEEEQRAKSVEDNLDGAILEEYTRATNRENEIAATTGGFDVRITANTTAINTLNGNASTVGSVDYKIAQAMSDVGGYKVTLDHTQESDPSTHYIYLEEDTSATGADKWEEWIYIYDEDESEYVWKMVGEVSLDLSNYVQNTDYATSNAFGVVKVDGSTITANNGVISAQGGTSSGVTSFNSRTGAVTPQSGDYSYSDITGTPSLATVATSGSYSDLSGTPSIPGGVKIGTTRAGASDTTLYFIRS